ncbi:oxidative damage protection protein [Buchnera aphidicola (Thelaxes californica)]|uniref:Oxidative damage protection protein n=1 Tax=Buchnera aphidicola (Thelaxes californica) TaxID=1315998 RepID=A0A4D6YD29_9GAMM|nr:oxidative damage protection protein [Buchnera aphidicola]QCI26952.1 oxidative damage protection protein [Buchnera aphidicola (Thelaxes californica)]
MNNRIIFCSFFKKNEKGLNHNPYQGKIGKRIYNEISEKAWNQWIKKQTILINEKKLNMFNKQDRKIIEKEMQYFLFKQ